MNLYHCATMYQVLEAIVHSDTVHQGEYNVLLLADFSTRKYHDYRELEAFFKEVRLFPYRSISNDPETILEEVENAYLESVPYGIAQFEHIYVAASYYYFSLYLIARRIPFHIFEDGGGILSKPKILYGIIGDITPIMAEIAQTYGLLDGRCEYVRDVICNFSAQSFIADDPKWKDFDPALEITHLRPETIRRILHFFRLEPICGIPENAAMVFTQQFANLYTTSRENQIAIYQVSADFFLPDQSLIIKPHPDDTVDYQAIFPEARIIRGRFPAELLPVLLDRIPETSFTVSSSSVRNIRSIFRKNILCGYDFPNTFRSIDRYYFALRLISEIESLKGVPVHTFGVDVYMLESIAEHSLKIRFPFIHETALKKETDCRQIWIIGDSTFQSDFFQTKEKDTSFAYREVAVKGVELPKPAPPHKKEDSIEEDSARKPEHHTKALCAAAFLEEAGMEDLLVFLNPRVDSCFFEDTTYDVPQDVSKPGICGKSGCRKEGQKVLRPGMIPLYVKKRRLREENVFFPDNDETIYAYTLDDGIKERVMRFHAEIVLRNAGLTEEIRSMDPLSEASVTLSDTRISMEEYLDLAMDLNDMSMKPFLRDKINLFLRPGIREYLRRSALETASASDEEIRQFLQTFGKITGKHNSAAGEGFRIYTDGEEGSGEDIVARIRADGADILEPYIRQHPAYQAIYPDSLNTLRVHTMRTSTEVRIFLPTLLSVGGDGAVTDVSGSTTRYRVLLAEDGSILGAFRQDPGKAFRIASRHHNTGYEFRQGRKLPLVTACLEFCRRAALYIPEMRYIGWDVAVTEKGPLIVEANNISASVYTYQNAKECLFGAGARSEVEQMLAFGMEGVQYHQETIYLSEPLVGVETSLPDCRRLYLILLQSALHRHGVEFYDREFITARNAARKSLSIRYLEEENVILLQRGQRTDRFVQPDLEEKGLSLYGKDKEHPSVSEKAFFALDQIAMKEADRIYRTLSSQKQ